jgi:hypothetical protein
MLPIDAATDRIDRLKYENAALAQRLDLTEATLRRWRRLFAAIVAAAILLVVGGARLADEQRVVITESLLIQDRAGNPKALLGSGQDGNVVLSMYDQRGTARQLLGLNQNGDPGLSFKDEGGRLRFGVGYDAHGTLRMEIRGSRDNGGLDVSSSLDGTTNLTVFRDQTRVLGMGADAGGTTGMTCYDRSGKPRANLGVRPNGTPTLQLLDQDGKIEFEPR